MAEESHKESQVARDFRAPKESESEILSSSSSSALEHDNDASSIRSAGSTESEQTQRQDDLHNVSLARTISRRRSHASGHEGEEWTQIERLISRMFGHERKANSEEEQTRHAGVVWKNLTVKGLGLGAALQATNGDIFLGIPRLIKGLFTRGRKGVGAGKPEIRTILDDFTVCLSIAMGSIKLNNDYKGMCSTWRNAACAWSPWFRLLNIPESNREPTKWLRKH